MDSYVLMLANFESKYYFEIQKSYDDYDLAFDSITAIIKTYFHYYTKRQFWSMDLLLTLFL